MCKFLTFVELKGKYMASHAIALCSIKQHTFEKPQCFLITWYDYTKRWCTATGVSLSRSASLKGRSRSC